MDIPPVIERLIARADSESRPGLRTDDAGVALVIEGGGMRGVISSVERVVNAAN